MISKTGVFAEYHLPANSIRWVFSGRFEINSADIKDADPEFILAYPDTRSTHINPCFSLGGIKGFENGISMGL